ncbi:hypothetical protein A0H81_11495 [Grifola frondosa]|uniref:Uncharacterized protein n=1 Tax=Grifola frondosa TaxID=5627 RepID=A0A1C7LVP0_GRIFR|nr:hypothetical protein A0H81_11495 [Grifola frondosa]
MARIGKSYVYAPPYFPPQPRPIDEETQVLTPPPSPPLDMSPRCSPDGEYWDWGYLAPRNSCAPFRKLYFSRSKMSYRVGQGADMDMRLYALGLNHQATIEWDGTDNADAVHITKHGHDDSSVVYVGVYVNHRRLIPGQSTVLRHGDWITFECSPMGPDEDFRFRWIQCTQSGWRNLVYVQDAITADQTSVNFWPVEAHMR